MNSYFSSLKKGANSRSWRRRHLSGASGFSLVEVTLALAIVTFSVMTLMGMIPAGLATFHKAAVASVSSQIVQQIVTDVQQTDYSDLAFSNDQVNQLPLRYFDDQGNEVTGTGGAGAVYQVNVVAKTGAMLTGGDANAPANLVCLSIDIVSNPGNVVLTYNSSTKSVVGDPAHGIFPSRYSAFVAKNQ